MRRLVVVGGGIAGVCCAEELCRLCPEDTVILISASGTLKVQSQAKGTLFELKALLLA